MGDGATILPKKWLSEGFVPTKGRAALLSQALVLRSLGRYALHPVEATLHAHRASTEVTSEKSHSGLSFEQAEAFYRAGAQGLRLSEIPAIADRIGTLSRLDRVDQAGKKALRVWAEGWAHTFDEREFFRKWEAQGRRGGAEHQVYHDQELGRWFKRLYFGVNMSTQGDYLLRMRMHEALFPETAYRLEGFAINAKNKSLTSVVSQPHVEVDLSRPLVSEAEANDLMAMMGFVPISLAYNGIVDSGYFAYLHPVTGVLVYDLHPENIVRLPDSNELVVIDPHISLARAGTWATIKLAEVGRPLWPDDTAESE